METKHFMDITTTTAPKKGKLFAPADGTFIVQRQEDGNYLGWTVKNGKSIEVRDVGPETVMQLLITHN